MSRNLNPLRILLKFRDGHATTMETLFRALGIGDNAFTSRGQVFRIVVGLIEAGLLRTNDEPGLIREDETKIEVTELLSKVQTALDISIKFLASLDRYNSMVVEPLFGVPGRLAERLDLFVLMPFKDDMLPVYEDHIKPICTRLKLTVRRGDDFFTADSVVKDIWNAIGSARLIVADCTDRNPNVFYEIGLAHAIGKPTILLTQKSEDVPFDLRHWRYIAYKLTPRGMKEFEKTFKAAVGNIIGKAPQENTF